MSNDLDFLNVDDLPGLLGETTPAPPLVVSETKKIEDMSLLNEAFKDDLNMSRETLRAQQEIMLQVAKELAKMAMTAEHPKVVETLGAFMGHLTTNAKTLVDIHKSARETAPVQQVGQQQINAENVFFGTPNDLLDQYGTRQDKKDLEGEVIDRDENRATE